MKYKQHNPFRWYFWVNLYRRAFIHRNLFLSAAEIRRRRIERHRKKRKEMYGDDGTQYTKFIQQIFKRDGNYCAGNCGRNMKKGRSRQLLTLDHTQPVSKGGKTVLENLTIMCTFCNAAKGNKYDPKIHKPRFGRDHSRNKSGMLPDTFYAEKTMLMPMPKKKGQGNQPTIYRRVPIPSHVLPSETSEKK